MSDFTTEKLKQALVLKNQNRIQDAVDVLLNLISEFPDFPLGYAHLGIIFQETGRLEEAKYYFAITVEKLPKSSLASLCLFHILWDMKDYQSALHEIKRFNGVGGKCDDYEEIVEELKTKEMIDDDLNWL